MQVKLIVFVMMLSIFIIFSCNHDSQPTQFATEEQANAVNASIQNDQDLSYEGNLKILFNGISTFTANRAPGTVTQLPNGNIKVTGKINEWYDASSDPRVTGRTIWYINAIIYPDGSRKVWGKGELIVDNNGGKWQMSWHGTISPDWEIVDYVVGQGKEGAVKGLVFKSTYVSVADPTQPPGFYYSVDGYIVDK